MNETLPGQATAAEPKDESQASAALHAALTAAQNGSAVPRAAEAPPPLQDEAPVALAPSSAPAALDATPVEHGIGVLLVNLGTPQAADAKAVRAYLK